MVQIPESDQGQSEKDLDVDKIQDHELISYLELM